MKLGVPLDDDFLKPDLPKKPKFFIMNIINTIIFAINNNISYLGDNDQITVNFEDGTIASANYDFLKGIQEETGGELEEAFPGVYELSISN